MCWARIMDYGSVSHWSSYTADLARGFWNVDSFLPCLRVKKHSEGLEEGLWTLRFLLLASGHVHDFRRWILAFFASDVTSHKVRSQSIFLDVRLTHTHFSREWASGFWTPMDLVNLDRRDRPCPAEWTVDFGPRRRKNGRLAPKKARICQI